VHFQTHILTRSRLYQNKLVSIHFFYQDYLPSQDNGENFKTIKTLQRGEETTPAEKRPAQVMPGEKGAGV